MTPTGLEARDAAAAAIAVKPRVTLDQIRSLIASERYFTDDTLTICVLTLTNGYKVTGESAAADPANFNEDLGRKIAREKATAEIWPLAGYLLRDKLHRDEHPAVARCKMTVGGSGPLVEPAADAKWDQENGCYDKVVCTGSNIALFAVYEGTAEDGGNACMENRIFGKATPFAHFQMNVRNPAVIAALQPGRQFYVDFIPAVSSLNAN